MPNITCPQCHSELEDDLVESTGRAECPFCGAEVAEALTIRPDSTSGGPEVSLPPAPPGSILKVIEATHEQRVFYIPGGRARSIGFFALIWNGFMAVFSTVFLGGMAGANEGWPAMLGVSAFLSLFWIIGIGMALWWVKAKFQRLFLMLQPQRLVIQRVLFGRKRIAETKLNEQSRAELVVAYTENDNPVYRIEIVGDNRTAKFGTALSREEKNWLVDRINEFLHPLSDNNSAGESPKFCSQCGEKLEDAEPDAEEIICPACGKVVSTSLTDQITAVKEEDDIDDAEIPQPPELIIETQADDHLRFHLPSCSHPVVGWVIVGVAMLFGGIFTGVALSSLFDMEDIDLLHLLFLIPFLLGGLIPVSVGLFFLRGRITVDLTPELLRVRYHLGLMGLTKKLPTENISRVKLMEGESRDSRIRGSKRRANQVNLTACVVQAGTKTIPLTLMNDKETARYVTQLVRRQLRGMGFELSDV